MERTNREAVGPGSLDEKKFLWRNVVLLVAFLILVAVGVVTVLVPELRTDEQIPRTGAQPASRSSK